MNQPIQKTPQSNPRAGTLDATLPPSGSLSGRQSVKYRAVSDRDIAVLRNLEKPVSLAIAALFTGLFLAGSYPVYQTVADVRGAGAGVGLGDLGIVIGWGIALGVAISATFASINRRSRILQTLDTMRGRPQLPASAKIDPIKPKAKKRTRFGLGGKKK